jgi:hypothetical protein
MTDGNLVWLFEEEVIGELVSYGAYFSKIKFFVDGIEHQEFIDNTDFVAYEIYQE